MARESVKLIVTVDKDAIPGAMHTDEDVRHAVGMILNDRIAHYNPSVRLAPPEE